MLVDAKEAAFEDAPEALDPLRVNVASDVLRAMADYVMGSSSLMRW